MLKLIGSLPNSERIVPIFRRETDCFLSCSLRYVLQFFVDMRLIYPIGSFRKAISSEHGFNHQRIMPTTG